MTCDLQHTRILIFYCNLQNLATCGTPEIWFSTVIYINPKDTTRNIKEKLKKTKGKLKEADEKHFNTKGNKGKSKKSKAKYGNTKGTSVAFLSHMELTELCRHRALSPATYSTPAYWFSNRICSTWRPTAHHDIDFLLEVTALGDLQHTKVLIFYCNL